LEIVLNLKCLRWRLYNTKNNEKTTSLSSFSPPSTPPSYSFKNSKKTTVGQLVSDGVQIVITNGFGNINNTYLCLQSTNLQTYNWHIRDYARLVGSTFTPLELVDVPEDFCVYLNVSNNEMLYPIVRASDWRTATSSTYDKGELAAFYITATIYLIACVFAIITSALILFSKDIKLHHIFSFGLIPLFFIRALYLYLIASGVISDLSVADYILQELPTFIFMTIYTFLVYMLSSILVKTSSYNRKAVRYGIMAFFVGLNVFLYLMYIMLIILFDQLAESPQSPTCAGRVSPSSPTNVQDIIRIVYRAVISGFAAFFALLFLLVGGSLYMKIRNLSQKTGGKGSGVKILVVGLICAFAFLAHALTLLIFAATDWASPYSVLILLAVEVIPGSIMLYLLAPKRLSTERVQRTITIVTTLSTQSTTTGHSSSSSGSSSSTASLTSSSDSSSSIN